MYSRAIWYWLTLEIRTGVTRVRRMSAIRPSAVTKLNTRSVIATRRRDALASQKGRLALALTAFSSTWSPKRDPVPLMTADTAPLEPFRLFRR
jgi:hypothetical protein